MFICKLDDGGDGAARAAVLSFVLDRGMPGFEQSPPLRKMGLHSSPTVSCSSTDVEVGLDRLIGGVATLGEGDRTEAASPGGSHDTRRSRRRHEPRSPPSGRASRRWPSG